MGAWKQDPESLLSIYSEILHRFAEKQTTSNLNG